MTELYRVISTLMQDTFAITISNTTILPLLIGATGLLFFLLIFTLLRMSGLKKQLKMAEKQSLLADEKIRTAEQQNIRDQIRVAKLITLIKNERKHGAEKLTLLG